MKKIIRWTLGIESKEGLDCLETCVKNFINFYGNEFEYFICFNNINYKLLDWSKKLKINLIDQEKYKKSLIIDPIKNHSCWKLYPPRIDLNSYEIFIDNDIMLYKKINFNKDFFMAEAIKKAYGTFQEKINYKHNLNAGFFGICPQFDFEKKINETLIKYNICWKNSYFEEQGLVAYILHKENCSIIYLKDVYICYESYGVGKYGIHFAGLNTNNKKYWGRYNLKYFI